MKATSLFVPGVFLIAIAAIGQDASPLAGYDGIGVSVVVFGNAYDQIAGEPITSSVLADLKRARIEEQMWATLQYPFLQVSVNVQLYADAKELYLFNVSLELMDTARLSSPIPFGRSAPVIVWQQSILGAFGLSGLQEVIEDAVDALVGWFLDDYIEANP